MNISNHKKGFTLIELLIVITIIGVLAAIGLTTYTTVLQRVRDSKRKQDIQEIQKALEAYRNDNGHYPIAASWVHSDQAVPWIAGLTTGASPYMKIVPVDPKNVWGTNYINGSYGYDPSSTSYVYNYAADTGVQSTSNLTGTNCSFGYLLVARLENAADTDLKQTTVPNRSSGTCYFPTNFTPGTTPIYSLTNP